MRISLIINVVLLVLVLLSLWFGHGSYTEIWRLENGIKQQQIENNGLNKQVNRLQAELSDLRDGNQGVEHKARSELGMTKPGETYYRFINADDSQSIDEDTGQPTEADLNTPTSEERVGSNIIFNSPALDNDGIVDESNGQAVSESAEPPAQSTQQ